MLRQILLQQMCLRNSLLQLMECTSLFTIKYAGDKFTNQKCSREVSDNHEAYIFIFTAHETTTYIISRVTKVDVYIITNFSCYFKGMLNQKFTEFLSLIFRCNTEWSERGWCLVFFKKFPNYST